jgi:ferrochelatase
VAAETKVLLIGFGGPESPDEIRPFIEEVLEGRPVPAERIDEVVGHYMEVGGRSPYTDQARELASALEAALSSAGWPLGVRLAMRKWRPRLSEVLEAESAEGTARLVTVTMSPHTGPAGGDRYVRDLERLMRERNGAAPRVIWTRPYFDAPGFIAAWEDRIRRAFASARGGETAHIVFTAHSVPLGLSEPYREEVHRTAGAIARALGRTEGSWSIAWQSRSGRPEDPWLEPDIVDEIARLKREGVLSILAAPIGFVCDHVEVLYDLGVEARSRASEEDVHFVLVPTVGSHPLFVGALKDLILEACR